MASLLTEQDFLVCSGSRRFARAMAAAAPFPDYHHAVAAARDIWFNKIDPSGWLEAFAAHPAIGGGDTKSISERCKEEQSAAMATSTDSTLTELLDWNAKYKEKFGFVFLICASGRSMPEILTELKKRFPNRPITELEIAAQEEMKIIELRLAKLFKDDAERPSPEPVQPTSRHPAKPKDRIGILGAHFNVVPKASANQTCNVSGSSIPQRTRPPITTHILDVSRGCPASGIEVLLERWNGSQQMPFFTSLNPSEWVLEGSSITDTDGRSGQLMNIVDHIAPGFYRISFNTGKYVPSGFFPYVSIVFEVKEAQRSEHFHVPLLLAPFSFSTYRGS